MRTGEVFALTWNDIDLDNRIIKVNKTVYAKDKEENDRWYLGTTKTIGGQREIYICDTLYSFLLKYKELQNNYKKGFGKNYKYYILEEVKNNNGKCYIAVENDKAVGLIMGCIFPYDEYDYLDYKCPKRGEITELVVSKNVRSKGIGNMLMNKMEEYFKSLGCEYILVDVFAYNDNAIKFYDKSGYHSRMYTNIKKIGD